MNLHTTSYKGRKYLSIVRGYRDPETGKVRHKVVEKLGYLDDLEKQYPDPKAHFRRAAAEMTRLEREQSAPAAISLDKAERLGPGEPNRRNLGYAALSAIYHELRLDKFLSNRARSLKVDYSVNAIMKLLVYSRALRPASKKRTYERRGEYFEKFDFSLDDVYHCLTFASSLCGDLQRHLHKEVQKRYGRRAETVYYDVTNYYFEIDRPDDLRRKGVSKDHSPNPIVQMGLFIDEEGIPISYGLFPGNANDCTTLLPMLDEAREEYGMGRAVIVADKGMCASPNIAGCALGGYGYVFSQTVRGGRRELKEWVLDEGGYRWKGEDYKAKSRLRTREATAKGADGKERKIQIEERQVAFYSRDYDRKAKADRAAAVQKAREMVLDPAKYSRATSHGAARYVKSLERGKKLAFDEERLAEEEKYDGYYLIATSETNKTDEEVIEMYRGLWRIEESFRVTKSDLEARPVYLSRQDRINAHFLVCFVALLIARLLQKRLGGGFSIASIAESLSRASCSKLEENWYVLDHCDEVVLALKEKMGIDLTRKYMQLGDVKGMLAATKKGAL
uniref:Mobile element protein n=1 Tax=uncultured bacterium contig00074 TaxID=1181553 RepID=A0A806KK37_9BACT|nr:mobile element protein [uncultured bacterium contig00074]